MKSATWSKKTGVRANNTTLPSASASSSSLKPRTTTIHAFKRNSKRSRKPNNARSKRSGNSSKGRNKLSSIWNDDTKRKSSRLKGPSKNASRPKKRTKRNAKSSSS